MIDPTDRGRDRSPVPFTPMTPQELAHLIDPEGRPTGAGGGRLKVRCPAHPDKNPSMTVWIDDTGKAALNCFAGCAQDAILANIPLGARDAVESTWRTPAVTILVPRRRHSPSEAPKPPSRSIEAEYPYLTETGTVAYVVRRFQGKKIRQFHPENGHLSPGRGDARLVPYRLPDVIAANRAGDLVYVVEGEKDADTLAKAGLTATTNVGGAGKWTDDLDGWFVGARVAILPDNDPPGHEHARSVYDHLHQVADHVSIIPLPDLGDKGDVTDWLQTHTPDELEALAHSQTVVADPDLAEFLDQPEPEYDWVVPLLLERGDRVILTGAEGSGKSTLLRQVAVQLGAGIHPFTLETIPAVRCLLIDLENSVKHTKRQLRPLRAKAGKDLPAGHVYPIIRPQGLDLLHPEDAAWLEERIKADQPDIVILGPIYKLVGGDPTEEQPAKAAATLLDRLRVEHGFALILEAHSPHGETGRKRPKRPYGASLWLRWPEFGLHIDDQGNLTHWRGARDERAWPALLKRGGEWPWSPLISPQDILWGQIVGHSERLLTRPSIRDLAAILDVPKTNIERALSAHHDAWFGMWKDDE